MKIEKLARNSAKCLNCGDEIESKHRHDMVSCKCYRESEELIYKIAEEISTKSDQYLKTEKAVDSVNHLVRCVLHTHLGTGFCLDGGLDYTSISGRLRDFHSTAKIEYKYLTAKEIGVELEFRLPIPAGTLQITEKMGGHIVTNPTIKKASTFINRECNVGDGSIEPHLKALRKRKSESQDNEK